MFSSHLAKLSKQFKQTGLKDLFCEATRAPNASEFEVAMRKLKDENLTTWQYLTVLEPRNGAFHAMDPRVKCDHITSNFVENFNSWVGEDRFKPRITMLEHIRSMIMVLIFTRQQIASIWDHVLPLDVYGKIKLFERKSRHVEVIRCHLYELKVILFDVRVAMKLDAGMCVAMLGS